MKLENQYLNVNIFTKIDIVGGAAPKRARAIIVSKICKQPGHNATNCG